MFFNKFLLRIFKSRRHQKIALAGWIYLLWFLFPLSAAPETVDGIAALVNEEAITLSDLKIAEAFGLFEVEASNRADAYSQILEKLIHQKLVIGLTRDKIPVDHPELVRELEEIKKRKEPGEFELLLQRFGFNESDILDYIQEKIIFERIIEDRFGLAIVVRLAEIENHYRNTYIPLQESKGEDVLPLLDVLGEIEMALRNEKMDVMVGDWISGLKREADIQILLQRRINQ
jgi:hypothetical protein